jgi:hypothetical protein
MGVGEHLTVNTSQSFTDDDGKTTITYSTKTVYKYATSFVEYYYYQ